MLDVARKAGVCKATVSYVLNNKANVSEETRTKVIQACKEINYTINPSVQDMLREAVSRSSRDVAFILVDKEFSDPQYGRIMDGIVKGVSEDNFHMVLVKLTGNEKSAFDLPPILRDKRVDGCLISGNVNSDILRILRSLYDSCVVLGSHSDVLTKYCSIIKSDSGVGAHMLIQRLKALGKTKIAIFGETLEHYCDREGFAAYKEALTENGLPVRDDLIYIGDGTFTGAYNYMQPIFMQEKLPFDAIIALDYRAAIEISYLLLGSRNINHADDVIVGTANPYAYNKLPVPHIYLDSMDEEIAYRAIKILIDRLTCSSEISPEKTLIRPNLVEAI